MRTYHKFGVVTSYLAMVTLSEQMFPKSLKQMAKTLKKRERVHRTIKYGSEWFPRAFSNCKLNWIVPAKTVWKYLSISRNQWWLYYVYVYFFPYSVRFLGQNSVGHTERKREPVRRLWPVPESERPKFRYKRTVLSDLRGDDVAVERRPEVEVHFRSDALTLGFPQSAGRRE